MLRLDINLVFTIINLLILYFLLQKFLFKPVNNILAQREEAIKKQFEEANQAKSEANELKAQYENSIAAAKEDSAKIVSEAKSKARDEYDRIVNEADAEAARRREEAQKKLAEDKSRYIKNMEAEFGDLVIAAAEKVVGENVNPESSRKLYDELLVEMGETK